MPKQVGTYFGDTVTYLCFHDESGALGLMLNRPTTIKLSTFLKQMECPSIVDSQKMILEGGPVGSDQGFILHSNDVMTDDSQILCKNLALTTSKDLLRRIGEGCGPEKYLVTLGYAGGSPQGDPPCGIPLGDPPGMPGPWGGQGRPRGFRVLDFPWMFFCLGWVWGKGAWPYVS